MRLFGLVAFGLCVGEGQRRPRPAGFALPFPFEAAPCSRARSFRPVLFSGGVGIDLSKVVSGPRFFDQLAEAHVFGFGTVLVSRLDELLVAAGKFSPAPAGLQLIAPKSPDDILISLDPPAPRRCFRANRSGAVGGGMRYTARLDRISQIHHLPGLRRSGIRLSL